MPPGGDKPPPLRQRWGAALISVETPESDPAPSGAFIGCTSEAMTPLPVPGCGQPGTTSP
jgi:hypothetical protein